MFCFQLEWLETYFGFKNVFQASTELQRRDILTYIMCKYKNTILLKMSQFILHEVLQECLCMIYERVMQALV